MQLRDYLYLDRDKLDNYLSGLDEGTVESVKQVIKTDESADHTLNPPSPGKPAQRSADIETVNERVLSISVKHSFSRLHDAIETQLVKIEGGEAPEKELRKNSLVEVTAEFAPSAVNQMIDSLLNLTETMNQMGLTAQLADPETQQMMQMITTLFTADKESDTTPMVSAPDLPGAFLFVAQNKFLLVDPEDFEGEMTLVGKVTRVVAAGESVDLLDLLKALPRSLRRGEMGNTFREAIIQLFADWPKELGGSVSPEALVLKGPAYVVNPLAVFN